MECQRTLAADSLPVHQLKLAPYSRRLVLHHPFGYGVMRELRSHSYLGFFSFSTLCGQGVCVCVYIPQVDPVPNEDSQLS